MNVSLFVKKIFRGLLRRKANLLKKFSFYAALSLSLGYIDFILPKPMPMLRYGLANLPVLLSVMRDGFGASFLSLISKITVSSVISMSFLSPVFPASMAGSVLAWLSMTLSVKIFKKRISSVGVSIVGALSNTWTQAFVLYLFLGKAVLGILPFAVAQGLVGAVFNGIAVKSTINYLERLEESSL